MVTKSKKNQIGKKKTKEYWESSESKYIGDIFDSFRNFFEKMLSNEKIKVDTSADNRPIKLKLNSVAVQMITPPIIGNSDR